MTATLGVLAQATAQGLLAALVDPAQALDAQTAATQGVDLRRLLWIIPREAADALRAADLVVGSGCFGLVVLYLCSLPTPAKMGHAFTRLARRAEQAGAVLLIVSDEPLAGAAAAVTLRGEQVVTRWLRAPGGRQVLCSQRTRLLVERNRLGRSGDATTLDLTR
jgi:hypothetical protein